MDIIGYVTCKEASEYVSSRYLVTSELRIAWERLDEDSQKNLLQQSIDALDMLPFTGRKFSASQEHAFPRWPCYNVPNAVKYAQIENALSLTDTDASDDAAFYGKLWQYGISSYSIGNLSESTSEGSWGNAQGGGLNTLVSVKARKYIQPFLGGGFRIE